MLIISGTIKLESTTEVTRVRDALVRRARKSRNDEGNIDYVFTQNIEDPTEIRLIEKWESEAALNSHLQIPDEEFNQVLATAKITSAVVVASPVGEEKELMER